MTPNDAAIYVGLLLSVPAAVSLGGIGVGFILLALVLRCGVDDNCSLDWRAANKMLLKSCPELIEGQARTASTRCSGQPKS